MNDRADLRERLRRAADWVLPQPSSRWTSDISADRLLIDLGEGIVDWVLVRMCFSILNRLPQSAPS